MKKLTMLCTGIACTCMLAAQPSFQTSLQTGISLPLNSNNLNGTHAGKAIHFGNHLDYSFGNSGFRFGLGAYIGYINALSADNKYKQAGVAIAEQYRQAVSQLAFSSTAFKSTHILLGPVASFGKDKCNINMWAKGGYGLNEPSGYAVLYKEGSIVNNVYVNRAGENKNGLAYSLGAGLSCALSEYTGLQLAAGYFSTQTDQVNYNFEREKGTAPVYGTASNQFIQASAGLRFTIGNPGKKNTADRHTLVNNVPDTGNPIIAKMDQKIKTKSNIKNDRIIHTSGGDPLNASMDQKIKTKSNIKNDRLINDPANDGNDRTGNDSLYFSPDKIELRTLIAGIETSRTQLQAVSNYLTGFVYQTQKGAVISQCGSNAMPGEPIPGIDIRLQRTGSAANDLMSARTNKDGSFSFSNIAPGNYSAEAGNNKMDITVNGNNENVLKILDIHVESCGNTKENYIIHAGDKTYVEVINAGDAGSGMATGKKHVGNVKYEEISLMVPRDAASGLATGKRMHKPYRVADMNFEINLNNIVASDGKLYAEVVTAREAGSGMATGRRSTIVTGDVDGDGLSDYSVVSPRDAVSGLPTGKRMHKPVVITTEIRAGSDEKASPRDAASGLATGKRMHKPYVFVVDLDEEADTYEIVSPRDAASGLPTGRRFNKKAEEGYEPWNNGNAAESVLSNPLYESAGSQGAHALFEARHHLRVTGSNGKEHTIFIPGNIMLRTDTHIAGSDVYEIVPVRWMTPESITAGKGIQENGIKKNEAAARKGWDGTVKGGNKTINEAGVGINEAAMRKGWDGTVKGNGMVKHIGRVHCIDGTCSIDAIVEADGAEYEAVISGVMKTKHDTAKNAVGNIR